MDAKRLLALVFGLTTGIGCGDSSSEAPNSGGSGGAATGGTTQVGGLPMAGKASGGLGSIAGNANGGSATGGMATGGTTASGGTASAGMASGGTASGGSTGGGGAPIGGSAGSGGGGGAGNPGAARPSKGCGVMDGKTKLTTGGMSVMNALPTSTRLTIMSGGMNREYIVDIPADYDPTHPYRLIFSWHQAYGSNTGNANGQYPANNGPNFDAKNYAYFGLHRESMAANQPSIFVAPGGIGNLPWDFTRDSPLFDALLEAVSSNLCIDESRVFTTGFSFGAMMSYGLSVTRQTKLRAAVTMAAANYNLPGQPSNSKSGNVAYFGITGMSDGTCPWVNNDQQKRGGKYCVLSHAEDNGCTIPANIETAMVGSKKYVCYDFQGCKDGYPVKACTFDGAHTPSSINDGSSNGDDGLKAFVPPLAWKFIAQF